MTVVYQLVPPQLRCKESGRQGVEIAGYYDTPFFAGEKKQEQPEIIKKIEEESLVYPYSEPFCMIIPLAGFYAVFQLTANKCDICPGFPEGNARAVGPGIAYKVVDYRNVYRAQVVDEIWAKLVKNIHKYLFSHSCNSLYQYIEFWGCSIQWFSSGKYTSRASSPFLL